MFGEAKLKIKEVPNNIVQELAKKHMNGYTPDYYGITFDGTKIVGKNKEKIKPSQARKFMNEVEKYFNFNIKENTVYEELEKDNDLYAYYTRHLSGYGFDFRTD